MRPEQADKVDNISTLPINDAAARWRMPYAA